LIPENIRQLIVNALQSGGISVGGISIPSTIPDTIRVQLLGIFRDQFAHSLSFTMRIAIIGILCGTLASLLVSSHIKGKKSTNTLDMP
jgi:hypothetical protein